MLPKLDELRTEFGLDDWSDSDLVREFSRVTGMEEGRAAEAFDLKINEPGFMTALKQPFGAWAESAGQFAADFIPGVAGGNALQNWGEDVQFQNPLAVQSLGEIPEKPWETIKQGVGQGLGYTAQYLGQDLLGKALGGIGGAIVGGPPGAVAGATAGGALQRAISLGGRAIQGVGKTISSQPGLIAGAGMPSYAGIREEQGSDDWWDKLTALAGSGAVGTIEVKFGIQPRLAKMLAGATTPEAKMAALAAVRQEMLSTTPLRAGLKEGAKVIGGEALEETFQTPIEQLAGYQNPLEPAQLAETGFGTVMGGIGALPFGGAYGTQRYMQRSAMGPQLEGTADDFTGLTEVPLDPTTPEGRQAIIDTTPTIEEELTVRDQTVEAIKREARAELERLGLQDVETVVVDRLFTPTGAEVDADYGGKILRVALDTAPEERANVINHEVVHALKELGLFKPKEWWVLERSAELSFKKNKQRMQQYIEAYGLGPLADLKQMDPAARNKLLEEAIADMNRDYKAGLLKPASGLRGLLDRLNNFLEATGNTLRGLGFQSSRDVLERIQRGEVGRRAAGEVVAPEGRAFNIRQRQEPLVLLHGTARTYGAPTYPLWTTTERTGAASYAQMRASVDRTGQPLIRKMEVDPREVMSQKEVSALQDSLGLRQEEDEIATGKSRNFQRFADAVIARGYSGFEAYDLGATGDVIPTVVLLKPPGGGPKYSLRRNQPNLYSALERAIDSAPSTALTGQEWLNLLTPRTGTGKHYANQFKIKNEELDWSGLRRFLAEAGDQVLPKQRLKLVTGGLPSVRFQGGWADDPNANIDWGTWQDYLTKPGRWTTPGLSRLGMRQARSSYRGQWDQNGIPGDPGFPTNHFPDTPNLIGWYRFGNLVTKDGKNYLYIDEIQSDWQQEYGSRPGTKGPMVDLRDDSYNAVPQGEPVTVEAPSGHTIGRILAEQYKREKEVNDLDLGRANPGWNRAAEKAEKYLEYMGTNFLRKQFEISRNALELGQYDIVLGLDGSLGAVRNELLDAIGFYKDSKARGLNARDVTGHLFMMRNWNEVIPPDPEVALDRVMGKIEAMARANWMAETIPQLWSIVRKDGTLVEKDVKAAPSVAAKGPGGVVEDWLAKAWDKVSLGRAAPAGPWVGKVDSYARLMLVDAVQFAVREGLDGVVIIPGSRQSIRNGKSAGDFVEQLYDKKFQGLLSEVAKELGGATPVVADMGKAGKGLAVEIETGIREGWVSPRPLPRGRVFEVLHRAEQSLSQSSDPIKETAVLGLRFIRDTLESAPSRVNTNSVTYSEHPEQWFSLYDAIDSATKPEPAQAFSLVADYDRIDRNNKAVRYMREALRAASTLVHRDFVQGLRNTGQTAELAVGARVGDIMDQLRTYARELTNLYRGVPSIFDDARYGITREMAGSLSLAIDRLYGELSSHATDKLLSLQAWGMFAHMQGVDLIQGNSVAVPGLRERYGQIIESLMWNAVQDAYAAAQSKGTAGAKGIAITPTIANAVEKNGSRKFSVRRRTAQQTSANPAQAARVFESMNRIFGTGLDAAEMGKVTARFNGFMKAMLTLPQIERENWTVPGVMQYTNAVRDWWATKGKWVQEWDSWVDGIRRSGYGKAELSALWRFANEVTLRSDALGRKLTTAERADEARKVGGIDAGRMAIWTEGRRILQDALNELEQLAMARAASVWTPQNDPAGEKLRQVQEEITKDFQQMRNRDYWPLARFGTYTVHVVAKVPLRHEGRDFKPGETMRFELFETEGEQLQRKKQLLAAHPNRLEVSAGRVDESLYSFQGLPPSMLRMIERELMDAAQEFLTGDAAVDADTMEMVKKQLDAVRIAMLHFSPENAFKQRMLRRKGTRGFTDDGLRAMAQLGQAFAGHIARAKHRGEMDEALKVLHAHRKGVERTEDPAMLGEGNKLGDLYNYLRGSQKYINNPGNDLANLRAAGFLWHLAFVPRAAIVQVAQPLFTTYPWLASRYGDGRAVAEMAKGYKALRRMFKGDWRSFRPDLAVALQQGMDAGILNQSLFTELAGLAEGSNLQRLMPGKFLKSQGAASLIRKAGYYGSFLFQKGEEVNRLVTFRAAYELEVRKLLGLEGGTDAQVQAALRAKPAAEQKQIRDLAYLAGRSSTEVTQGEYSRWARPTIMRGKMSAVLLFKMYPQIMTYFAARDPGALRFMAIQLAIAGALGLPFAGDIMDLAKALCNAAGGEDCNLEHMVREYVQELGVNPELAMHGLARVSTPWDFSASMSLGRIVPMVEPLTDAMMPGGDFRSMASRTQEEALGALFSIPLKWMQAISTGNERDIEQAMPTIVRDVYRTYRRFREGGEQSRSGAMMADIDWADPMDVVTHLGQAAGLRPVEIARAQEVSWAQKEAGRYWSGRREAVVGQFYHLYKAGGTPDREALADVLDAVRAFNASVPFPEMQISSVQLRKGLKLSLTRQRLEEGGVAPEKKYRRLYSEIAEGFEPAY